MDLTEFPAGPLSSGRPQYIQLQTPSKVDNSTSTLGNLSTRKKYWRVTVSDENIQKILCLVYFHHVILAHFHHERLLIEHKSPTFDHYYSSVTNCWHMHMH